MTEQKKDRGHWLGPVDPGTWSAIQTVAKLAGKAQAGVIADLVKRLEAPGKGTKSVIAQALDQLFQQYEAERRKQVQEAFGGAPASAPVSISISPQPTAVGVGYGPLGGGEMQ